MSEARANGTSRSIAVSHRHFATARFNGLLSASAPFAHHWKVISAHRITRSKVGIEWQLHRARTRIEHSIVATPSCGQAAASTIGSLVAGRTVQCHHMMDDDVTRLQVKPDYAVV